MSLIRKLILPVAGVAALSACGGNEPAPQSGDFAAACNAQGNLDPELCGCLDEQAQALDPDSYRFVLATIAEDDAEAQRLRGDLDEVEATQAAQFISRGIQACIIDLPSENADQFPGGDTATQPAGAAETPPAGDEAMGGETAMSEPATDRPAGQ